jgi:hypothetical protein
MIALLETVAVAVSLLVRLVYLIWRILQDWGIAWLSPGSYGRSGYLELLHPTKWVTRLVTSQNDE